MNSDFFFILMSASNIKNLNLPPSIPCPRICGDPEDKNFNAIIHGPSKLSMIDRRRAPTNCCLLDRQIATNTMAWNGRGRILFFFLSLRRRTSDTDVKKKILNLPPPVPHYRICGDQKGNNSNPGIRHPSIRGSSMDNGCWRSGF